MLIYTEPSNVCMVTHIPAHDIHYAKRMKRMAHHTRVGYSDIACGTQPNALGLINMQRVDLFAAQTVHWFFLASARGPQTTPIHTVY